MGANDIELCYKARVICFGGDKSFIYEFTVGDTYYPKHIEIGNVANH